MRKLYISYKSRDCLLLDSKKSILYSLIMKTVISMWSQMNDNKIMRIADSTSSELLKEML